MNEQKFKTYDEENPHVYKLIVEQINRRKAWHKAYHGKTPLLISVYAIIEWLRWEVYFTSTDERFKISNDTKPWYVRKYVKEHPEDREIFIFRKPIDGREEFVVDHTGQLRFQ